jgi:serralysin
MVLRNKNTGKFELYNISNNSITSASNLGTVGLTFQVAGFGDFNADGTTDMMLRSTTSGQFELYDIVNNQITSAFNIGTVGLDFSGRGFCRLQPGRHDRHDAAQQKHGPIRSL